MAHIKGIAAPGLTLIRKSAYDDDYDANGGGATVSLHHCGAKLVFAPGTNAMECPYCGAHNGLAPVISGAVPLLDFLSYAEEAAAQTDVHDAMVVKCTNCGAETKLAEDVTAGRCAFCGAPIVAEARSVKLIKPGGLLPFLINNAQANELFKKWIATLYFAPKDLARRAEQAGMDGVFIPCWTFDARTETDYQGERGDDYEDRETYRDLVNGHYETETRAVTKTRWGSVNGHVTNMFHDLLVLATDSLPDKQSRLLQPWDLAHVVPYADEYLSGMTCQSYQVDLSEAFDRAKHLMDGRINFSIERDIGGDHQQIKSRDVHYQNVGFRHLLLPLWISAYQYQGKTYRFLVNARSGAVRGERPWSTSKIGWVVGIVLAVLAVIAGLVVMAHLK